MRANKRASKKTKGTRGRSTKIKSRVNKKDQQFTQTRFRGYKGLKKKGYEH